MRIRKITFKGITDEGLLVPGKMEAGAPPYRDREYLVNWLQKQYGATSKSQSTWGLAWRDCEFQYPVAT